MHQSIADVYGNRLRLRVCGVCIVDQKILLVNHRGLREGDFWAPPGGGMEFGTTAEENLAREVFEETGLKAEIGAFRFACEYLNPPLHSVELFFDVTISGGILTRGKDPELDIIKDVRFFSWNELQALPYGSLHGVFRLGQNREEFEKLGGFYRI